MSECFNVAGKFLLCCILIVLLQNQVLIAQEKYVIHFQGNISESEHHYIKNLEHRRYTDSSQVIRDLARLKDSFFARGYIAFSVDKVEWKADTVTVRIDPGIKYKTGKVDLMVSDTVFFESPVPALKADLPLSSAHFEQYTNECIAFYENRGFPFVTLRPDSLSINAGKLTGRIFLEPGPKIYVDSVLNRTGIHLSQKVMYRLTGLKPGDPFNQYALEKSDTRLASTGFLQVGRKAEPGFFDNKAWLYLYPIRVANNRFDGWVGITSSTKPASGIGFMGSADLLLHNLAGQAETWNLAWNRTQDQSQKLAIGIRFPYPAGLPVGIEGEMNLRRQDTSWFNLDLEARIPYHFTPAHSLSLVFAYNRSDLLGTDYLELTEKLRSYHILLTGLSWRFQNLDELVNPTQGCQLETQVLTGQKNLDSVMSGRQYECIATADVYTRIHPSWVIRANFRAGYNSASYLLVNELYMIGGYQSIRGFDEDAFRTPGFITGNLELRYLMNEYSHLLAFFDQGYILASTSEKTFISLTGFGLGTQIKTGGGIFKILLGLGTSGDMALSFKSAKIHIGYIGLF